MRLSVSIFALALALEAVAFDSGLWLGKRALLDREAERLRAAYTNCLANTDKPAENLTIPVESHPDGSVKASVTAKRAKFFLDTGFVWGEEVLLRQFSTNGAVEASVEAEQCVVDRNTKSGWVEGHAKAVYDGTVLEGDGVYLSFPEEYVKIFKATDIRATENGAIRALKAKRTDFDRKAGVALFAGDVSLDDGEYALKADQAYVFLSGTNDLKRIVALGNVSVTNGTRSAACAMASYTRADSRLVMFAGDDGRLARLEDAGSRKGAVEGKKITFWIDSEQVEVEGAEITVDAKGVKLP